MERSKMLILHCIAILVLVVSSKSSLIPFDGAGHALFRKGSSSGVKVEVYLDLACSDCAEAWPSMVEAVQIYEQSVQFIFRLFPLPYHHNAFTAAQAAQVVSKYSDDVENVESFVGQVFKEQERILNSETSEMIQTDIQDIFAAWAEESAGINAKDFHMGIADSSIDLKARYEFKYSCLHGVAGTPTVFVGGVLSESLSSSDATLETWRNVLDGVTSVDEHSYPYRPLHGAMDQ